jgi:hypothetical protein
VGDVYVLSLPSFWWTRIDVQSELRTGQVCHAQGGQMVVSGGFRNWERADKWEAALGVFDMSRLEWAESYDPDAGNYTMPETVQKRYVLDGRRWNNLR